VINVKRPSKNLLIFQGISNKDIKIKELIPAISKAVKKYSKEIHI
jgi:hypothetical protein